MAPVSARTWLLGGLLLLIGVAIALLWLVAPTWTWPSGTENRPFADPGLRLLLTVALLALPLVMVVIGSLLAERRARRFAYVLTQQREGSTRASRVELRQQRESRRMYRIARRLREGAGRAGSQRPWILALGPPGAGVTSLCEQNGLAPMDREERPPRGLESCAWVMTEDAVLVDVSGTAVAQTSRDDATEDDFATLVRTLPRTLGRDSFSAILLALDCSRLLTASNDELSALARLLRRRLIETAKPHPTRPPVYLVLTQADRLIGFAESFARLNPDERRAAFGWTFDWSGSRTPQPDAAQIERSFAGLIEGLQERQLQVLQAETDSVRRSRSYLFLRTLETLAPRLGDVLATVFRSSRYETLPQLRGYYFTSVRQGDPLVDGALLRLDPAFGLVSGASLPQPIKQQVFFVARLFRDVVLRETGLTLPATPGRRLLRGGAWAALLALTVAGSLGFVGLLRDDSEAAEMVATLDRQVALELNGVTLSPVSDSAPWSVVPALNRLADLDGRLAALREEVPRRWLTGQRPESVADASERAYRRALSRLLLPRLVVKLEEEMIASLDQEARLSLLLDLYLALTSGDASKAEPLRQFFAGAWSQSTAPERSASLQQDAERHLRALTAAPWRPTSVNQDLLERAAQRLGRTPEPNQTAAAGGEGPGERELFVAAIRRG
ncbi:MAG: type VI secretion protein IcmF/TssM N-terminal domain-containing protein [Kiloniellales bacterium]